MLTFLPICLLKVLLKILLTILIISLLKDVLPPFNPLQIATQSTPNVSPHRIPPVFILFLGRPWDTIYGRRSSREGRSEREEESERERERERERETEIET